MGKPLSAGGSTTALTPPSSCEIALWSVVIALNFSKVIDLFAQEFQRLMTLCYWHFSALIYHSRCFGHCGCEFECCKFPMLNTCWISYGCAIVKHSWGHSCSVGQPSGIISQRGLLSLGLISPICAGPVVASTAPADWFRVGSTSLVLSTIVPVGLGSVAL